MGRALATGAAAMAVGLMGLAVLFMSDGNLRVAGALFLCASLTIYLRETYLVG